VLRIPAADPLGYRGPVLTLDEVSVGYVGPDGTRRAVVSGCTMDVTTASRVAVVGRNGEGKSTLLRALAGAAEPLAGSVRRHATLRVAYFSQELAETLSAADAAAVRRAVGGAGAGIDQALARLSLEGAGAARGAGAGGDTLSALELLRGKYPEAPEGELRKHLARFGLPGALAGTRMEDLSGGQRVRAALAAIVWRPPHVLVLDEPSNHLDLGTAEALAEALRRPRGAGGGSDGESGDDPDDAGGFAGGVVLASHDRALMRRVADTFYVVRDGGLKRVQGGMDEVMEEMGWAH